MKNDKNKILVITDSLPYPLKSGGKICTYNFIDSLRNDFEFTVIYPFWTEDSVQNKDILQKIWPEVHLKGCDIRAEIIPPKEKGIVQLLNLFKRGLEKIISKIKRKEVVSSSGKLTFTKPFEPQSSLFIDFLVELIHKNNFDIIQVQYAHNLNLFPILSKESIKIFELIELQFDVIRDFAKTQKLGKEKINYHFENSEILEVAYMNLYDVVFTLNEKDRDYLNKKLSYPDIYCSPFGVLNQDFSNGLFSNKQPVKLIFSGGDAHYPNFDALEWYLKDIHLHVLKEMQVSIHVTGVWSESSTNHFRKIFPEIHFEGFIENFSEFLNDGIVIVPVRIGGGGLRTKIIYAMANGAPVVSTSIGAYGINPQHNHHCYIADTSKDFAESILELIRNNAKRNEIIHEAFNFAQENFSQLKTSEKRKSYYLKILQKRKKTDNQ